MPDSVTFTNQLEAYFGETYPKIARFGDLLVSEGIERGLIGPREADRIWERHLVNCAGVCQVLPTQGTLLDLGSGAGLPGIVIAIMRPQQPVLLLESLLRRTTWLEEVASKLGLDNVEVVRGRAGENLRLPKVAAVTARAVAPLDRLMTWSGPLLHSNGALFALKGETAIQELNSVTSAPANSKLQKTWDLAKASIVDVETIEGITPTIIVKIPKR